MKREHQIERVVKKPQDYKYCDRCGKINWHENTNCIGCHHKDFKPMNDEYGKALLLDWEKEPDLLLEV